MEKGHTNNPNGRPKGALNKRTEKAMKIIEEAGIDPIEYDALILNWKLGELGLSEEEIKEIDVRTQLEMRQNASDSLKPYLYSKLRTTEIKVDDEGGPVVFRVAYPDK